MAEYVDREAIKSAIRKRVNNSLIISWLISIVNTIPAAEVAPVVHGRWLHVHVAVVDTTGDCSACNTEAVWRTRRKPYSLCPNCGARMDGDGNG